MAATKVSPDADAIVIEIQIAAPPQLVFRALIDPQQVMDWWKNEAVSIEKFHLEPKVGGRWGYQTKQTVDGVNKFCVQGEVLAYDPPRLLAYSWIANLHKDPARRTEVRWELTPVSGGTLVKLTHSGLAQEPEARSGYSSGWPGLLDRLKKFVEK
jgi:uncharacterized protein YndB with AHSA1/START domain